jgi:hypothetical protein
MDESLAGAGAPWPARSDAPPVVPGEPAELARLAGEVPLAPRVWIPAEAEEAFYRLNHLPPRLRELFAPIASRDPDEDDVEEIAPLARELLARHVLLDTWVDAFYDAVAPLAERVRVRRAGTPGRTAARGRPALLALRAVWAEAWSDAAVTARLRATGSVALGAAPVLIHDAEDVPAGPELTARVAEILGAPRAVATRSDGAVTRLGSAARPGEAAAES